MSASSASSMPLSTNTITVYVTPTGMGTPAIHIRAAVTQSAESVMDHWLLTAICAFQTLITTPRDSVFATTTIQETTVPSTPEIATRTAHSVTALMHVTALSALQIPHRTLRDVVIVMTTMSRTLRTETLLVEST